MKILQATERSIIDIPAADLINQGGGLKIRPDILGRGLIEVQQSQGALKLRINGLVGRVPITDNIYLDVRPKFPIANLNRVIYASKKEMVSPFSLARPYMYSSQYEYLPIPLILTFCRMMKVLIEGGLLRTYRAKTIYGTPRNRINFMKSHQLYWGKLKPAHAVMDTFEYSNDNLPNQILKIALQRALGLARHISQLQGQIPLLADALRNFENISNVVIRPADDIGNYARIVPSFRKDYLTALEIALQLIVGRDVSLDTSEAGLDLDSYIVCLDDVFEGYIRHVLSVISDHLPPIRTVDGNNLKHQRYLFTDNKKYRVKPDLIFQQVGKPLMIGDVKYKLRPQEDDRYQVFAHAMAYNVPKAVLIYPRGPNDVSGMSRLGNIGGGKGIDLYEYYFDLAGDLTEQELNLKNSIRTLIMKSS